MVSVAVAADEVEEDHPNDEPDNTLKDEPSA
jgi:hypothetical protein